MHLMQLPPEIVFLPKQRHSCIPAQSSKTLNAFTPTFIRQATLRKPFYETNAHPKTHHETIEYPNLLRQFEDFLHLMRLYFDYQTFLKAQLPPKSVIL
jgi:hypothetical protein